MVTRPDAHPDAHAALPPGAAPGARTTDGPGRMAEWPTGRLLSVAARAVERTWHAGLAELGLTHAGLIVLDLLADGPVAQVELADRGRVTPQTMSRTVDTLEAAGFVRRLANPLDRRHRMVERSAAGERAFAASWSLESRIFPDVEGVGELRRALLQIIRESR